VVTKSGSFFSYGEERIGQGRNNAKGYLVEHPEIAREIEAKVYEALGIDRPTPPIEAADGDGAPTALEPVSEKAA
jgi:recombination protein RecA